VSLVDCDKCRMRLFAFGRQCKDCHHDCGLTQSKKRKKAKVFANSSPRKKRVGSLSLMPSLPFVSPDPPLHSNRENKL
jgi:hypothetical protein